MAEEFDPNILFLINKSGIPLDQRTWDRMFRFSIKLSENDTEKIENLRSSATFEQASVPVPPLHFNSATPAEVRVGMIQDYMKELQYNHTGTQFFDIKKYRPLSGLNDTAKEIIRESLPIKCLEAVILGIYLTNGIANLERFTIGFKSEFDGCIHRHVVLGVYHSGNYGALGMSRRDDLMYKPLQFKSLYELILDFRKSYEKYWHNLKRVKIGLPISHNPHSFEPIPWKGIQVLISKTEEDELKSALDKFSKTLRSRGTAWPTAVVNQGNLPHVAKSEPNLSTGFSKRKESSHVVRKKTKNSNGKSGYQIRI